MMSKEWKDLTPEEQQEYILWSRSRRTHNETELICPYCFHVMDPDVNIERDVYYNEYDNTITCDDCGNQFYFFVVTQRIFSTVQLNSGFIDWLKEKEKINE